MEERNRKDTTDRFYLKIQFGTYSSKTRTWSSKLLSLAEAQMCYTGTQIRHYDVEQMPCLHACVGVLS